MFEVPASFYTKAHCFPVLASPSRKDRQIGASFGTLSVLHYNQKVVVVTALHVLEDCMDNIFNYRGAERIYSPLLPDWGCVDLGKYTWRRISDPRDKKAGSYLDLAYAVLTPDQANELEIERVRLPAKALDLKGDIYGVLQGYSGNKNNMAKIRSRSGARPMSVAIRTNIVPLAVFVRETYSEYMAFDYPTDQSDVWNDDKHYNQPGEKLPSLDGLSGGPVFYCCDVSGEIREEPKVIGFFIEYDKKKMQGRFVAADILLHTIDMLISELV
jgi:hypothetical protein